MVESADQPFPNVVIVDDHPLVATSLQGELGRAGLRAEVAELTPAPDLVAWIASRQPDCVLLDLGLPYEGGGAALVGPIVETGTRVLVLTGETDPSLLARCSRAGAEAVLSKGEPLDEIVAIVRQVTAGTAVRSNQTEELRAEASRLDRERARLLARFATLSPREEMVLAGLMDGHGPADQAERDLLSVQTVRTQVKSVLRKLGVRSQLEAAAHARRCGWQPGMTFESGPSRSA